MDTAIFKYWEDNGICLGYLEEYPDYMTQGQTLNELKENLKDLLKDTVSNKRHPSQTFTS